MIYCQYEGLFSFGNEIQLVKGRIARMGDKSFVPFYLMPNKQRISHKEIPTKFPNYMALPKQAHMQRQNNYRHLNNRRAFLSNAQEMLPSKKNSQIQPPAQMIKSTPERNNWHHFDNDAKETYYQKIRDELDEMAFYQSRRPFKATEVPTIWRNTNSESANIKSDRTFLQQSGKDNQNVKENRPETGKSNSVSPASKRKHLNRGLDVIMDQERPRTTGQAFIGSIKAGNNEHHNKTNYVPFLDKHQMNGDKRQND